MLTDTFSANSLKILDKEISEFKNKYINNFYFYKKDIKALTGSKYHSLISFYIKGFDINKLLFDLDKNELISWKKLEEKLKPIKKDFIHTEHSFLIKDKLENETNFFLTGRFDAILKKENNYIIYDWKTNNLPKNPENDLQTIVYLYCASKIFNTKNISMKYVSIEKQDEFNINFESEKLYKKRITDVIQKLFS